MIILIWNRLIPTHADACMPIPVCRYPHADTPHLIGLLGLCCQSMLAQPGMGEPPPLYPPMPAWADFSAPEKPDDSEQLESFLALLRHRSSHIRAIKQTPFHAGTARYTMPHTTKTRPLFYRACSVILRACGRACAKLGRERIHHTPDLMPHHLLFAPSWLITRR